MWTHPQLNLIIVSYFINGYSLKLGKLDFRLGEMTFTPDSVLSTPHNLFSDKAGNEGANCDTLSVLRLNSLI